jgi:chromosome segregation ATPase
MPAKKKPTDQKDPPAKEPSKEKEAKPLKDKEAKPVKEKEAKPVKEKEAKPAKDKEPRQAKEKELTAAKKPVPQKKEKDYGSLFTLLLPPQLEDLDLKIESKLRIQEALSTKDWKLLQKSTQQFIDSLSIKAQELLREFQKLKNEQKQNTNQLKLQKMNQDLEKELKEKKALQDQISKTQENIKKANSELVTRKEKLEEELNQETASQETIKTEITIKDLELNTLKENIMQVSSQIGLIKSINAQFNANIEKINTQIEEANKRYYEAKAKSENSASLKEKILECQRETVQNEKKILKYYRRFKEMQAFMNNKEKEIQNLQQLEKKIEEALDTMPDFQKEQSAQALEKILKSLAEPKKKLERPAKKNKTLEQSVKIRNVELVNLIKLKEIEKKSKEKMIPDKEGQILEVKELIKANQEIYDEKTDYFKKQVVYLQGQINSLTKKQDELKSEFNKKQENIEKTKKKFEETSEKLSQIQKTNESSNIINELRKRIDETTKALFKTEQNSMDSLASDKEKQMAHILLQLDVLKQEVAGKDSEVVLKVREKQKADERLEVLKAQMQKLGSKLKTAEAEILAKVNEEIENKDKQIEVLKEMLRGSHAEMKVKDVVLNNYKSKLDESSKMGRRKI